MKFTAQDIKQLKASRILPARAEEQIRRLKKGFSFIALERPATVSDGILRLNGDEQFFFERKFLEHKTKKIVKFVPASGAASRMFHFLEDPDAKHNKDKEKFLKHLRDFAFYEDLKKVLKKRGQQTNKLRQIVSALLDAEGLNYRQLPKGAILFHGKGARAKTAFEEQLEEAAALALKKTRVHFTLAQATRTQTRRLFKKIQEKMRGPEIEITDSVQSPATNHLALEKNGKPARGPTGQLLLRPSGHGALLQNLNGLSGDAIFIKNIDNIFPKEKRGESERWKKILGGIYFDVQEKIFEAQRILERGKIKPEELLFALKTARGLIGSEGMPCGREALFEFFNRPLRIAGMVMNAGEPGGGPFWTRERDGKLTLQIVESTEVNMKDRKQRATWNRATHFNPVDFVCGLYDYRRRKYNLSDFVNTERGILAKKSYSGREIQTMELPGLWNGSMADWITVFVEVPATTFAPVKTALDLLKPEHQFGRAGSVLSKARD